MANTYSLDLESSSTQYASISDASQTGLDLTGTCTFEVWVKHESLPADGAYGQYYISKGAYSGNYGYYFYIYRSGSNYYLALGLSSNGTNYEVITKQVTPVTGTYKHYAVTFNPTGSVATFYQDGSSLGTSTGTYTSIYNNNAKFSVGAYTENNAYYDGLIDEVRVWNVVRTATQISDNLYQDVSGQSGLVGYWKFNNDYTDSSGNGNTLTPSGSPVFSTDVPFALYLRERGNFISLL